MSANTPRTARAQGFTLVETMVAAAILMVGILGTFTMVDGAQTATRENSARTMATALGREITEHARSLDYHDLTPSTFVTRMRTRPNMGTVDATGTWRIVRRGIIVEVVPTVCTFDDPMDGLSPIPPQNACPAAQPIPGTAVETNPDDFRRVKLTMSWVLSNVTHTSSFTAQISNPSGGTGPRIVSLPDPFTLQVTTGVSIPFVVTTTTSTTVRWSMDDGVSVGDAVGGPTGWNFVWNIGTVGLGTWTYDGTYTASVQPFDSRGVPGERRAATVLLNRRAPLAPANLAGGRSDAFGGVVELEWSANPERDILGYRVYRTGSTSIRTRVCPPSTATADEVITTTSCQDTNPGSQPLYTVVAVDRPTLGSPASGTREGDATTMVVSAAGPRPDPPTAPVATVVAGRVSLSWTPPGGLTPLFYRVYRNGERIDRTATDAPEFVDPLATDGTLRRYTITAVSHFYNESAFSTEVIAG